ncbi:hypothetical protein GQ543_03685 [candidate division WOR-3 bacterium]|nr:hypothetical protein [candidate division WOR-3 bacterium]
MAKLKRVTKKETKPERVAALEVRISNIYTQYRQLLPTDYKWEDEHSRWNELVYCIFTELTQHSYKDARSLSDSLSELNLLDVEDLANVKIMDNGMADPDNKRIMTITDILISNDISESDVKKTLSAICKVAQAIMENYDGKIQKFLRKYGQDIVDEFDSHVSFSEVDKGTQSRILVKWIQNTLSMPLAFSNVNTAKFCEIEGVTYLELAEAADNIGLNGAVLDDLIELFVVDAQSMINK